jgi:hypothetical protein
MNLIKATLIRTLVFILISGSTAIYLSRVIWSIIDQTMNWESVHFAAGLIIRSMNESDSDNKFVQMNFVQSIIDLICMPAGIAAGFAALWLFELWNLNRKYKT